MVDMLKFDFFFSVCSLFFEWDFFLKSLNLANQGQEKIASTKIYQSCQVVPESAAYYNYQLENKWVRINPEMFKVEKTQRKLVFKVCKIIDLFNAWKPAALQPPLWPVTHSPQPELHCPAVCISFHETQSVIKNCNGRDV